MAGLDTRGLASGFAQGISFWRPLKAFRITTPRTFNHWRMERPQFAQEVG